VSGRGVSSAGCRKDHDEPEPVNVQLVAEVPAAARQAATSLLIFWPHSRQGTSAIRHSSGCVSNNAPQSWACSRFVHLVVLAADDWSRTVCPRYGRQNVPLSPPPSALNDGPRPAPATSATKHFPSVSRSPGFPFRPLAHQIGALSRSTHRSPAWFEDALRVAQYHPA
jgi:hypothetical protein